MQADQFKSIHKLRPFKPITIETDSGESYPVPHPENMWISPLGGTVIVSTGGESFAMLDMLKITGFHVNKAKAKGKGGA